MITWLLSLFRRRASTPPPAVPESPATLKSQEASRTMEATTSRIDAALDDIDRRESLWRKRTGNFAEDALRDAIRRQEGKP